MGSFARAAELWRSLEIRAQIALVVSALAVLGTGYFLFSLASKPSYTVVASGMTATDGGDVANSLESAGITYKLRDGGATVAVLSSDVTKARVQLAQDNLPNGGHAGLRALRQVVARRHRLPAEDQVPARARRRDRPHDRVSRRRPLGRRAARAAQAVALPRRRHEGERGRAAAERGQPRRLGRRRHRAARLLERRGPQDRRRDDHRRDRRADLADLRQRRRHLRQPPAGRAAVLERRVGADRLDARLDARAEQGVRPRPRRPRPRPADDRVGHLRQDGHEAHRHLRRRDARRQGRHAPRRRPRPARPATSASPAPRRPPAARRSTATRRATPPSASTRPSRARSSCRAPCSACRSRSSSTRASPPPRSPRSRASVAALAGIDKKRGDTLSLARIALRQAGDDHHRQARAARRDGRPARRRQVGAARPRRPDLPLPGHAVA